MYAIKLGKYFISGFDEKYQIIQITNNIELTKKFKTKKSAYKWCENHKNSKSIVNEIYNVMEI